MAEADSSAAEAGGHGRDLAAIGAGMLALMMGLALASHADDTDNLIGNWGHAVAQLLTAELGRVAWGVPLEVVLVARDLLTRRSLLNALGRVLLLVVVAALLHVGFPHVRPALGGELGVYAGQLAQSALGLWGVGVVGVAALLCLITLYRASLGLEPLWQWLGFDLLLQDDTAAKLVQALAAHGVFGTIEAVQHGPATRTYEFAPSAGMKVSRIAALADDLTLSLGLPVRVIAPMPGKKRVGFELALSASKREAVSLRKLLEDTRWAAQSGPLPIAIGRDTAGQPVYGDLSHMPHLLIAGTTGAGKSVGLNAMLASLLTRRSADELRLLVVDPKMVEFAAYERIPHLLTPVITDGEDAARALRWAVGEMERRYQLFADAGTRHIAGFNERTVQERLPYIVIVVDELADLLMAAAKDVETSLARLAQKARAAGIHLVLATQRPSADVVTGTIKANFPARIAYKVSQREDSRTILGRAGAEHLLGQGDMLMLPPGSTDLRRIHGAHVTDAEITALCLHLCERGEPRYDPAILGPQRGAQDASALPSLLELAERTELRARSPAPPQATVHALPSARALDELYTRAVALVAAAGSCSISHLQRQLGIGYNKAAKLVERMEGEGIVGPAASSTGGRREVRGQAACESTP